MGILSLIYPTCLLRVLPVVALLATMGTGVGRSQTATQALTVPLMLPGAIAYDAQGDLYFVETGSHLLWKVDPTGVLTTVAGTGVQGFDGDGGAGVVALLDSPQGVAVSAAGVIYVADTHNQRIRRVDSGGKITTVAGTGAAGFSGDGGAATAAVLDGPTALALDGAGNLFLADRGNHRVRRVDAGTGLISTVAGNGAQGFAGDGGPAPAAEIDSPDGIAVNGVGDLFLADTHNHRVRRVDHATGAISTVAGVGVAGFAGDAGSAVKAGIALPRGLVVDANWNLYIADSSNHRIRRVDATTGAILTVAGDGVEGFVGDGGAATAAELDSPRAVTLSTGSPGPLVTLSDTGNGRVRQVDSAAEIQTVAGLGNVVAGALALAGPATASYGAGDVTATLAAGAATSAATGTITFFDTTAGTVTLGSVALSQNAAVFSTAGLGVGAHHLSATYAGDATHAAAQSSGFALTVTPAAAMAMPMVESVVYGIDVPVPTGTLTGVLARDAGAVAVVFSTAAAKLSPVGSYPITAELSGAAAGNYALTTTAAAVTVTKAASVTSANLTAPSVEAGSPVPVAVVVAPTTAGVPSGPVGVLEGGSVVGTGVLAGGAATVSVKGLGVGTHSLVANYAGDGNFLASASAAATETVTGASSSDFTLSAGAASASVIGGSAAVFSFTVANSGAALASPVLLSVTGLPVGATASFNPGYLPPGSFPATFQVTVQTASAAAVRRVPGAFWGLLVLVLLVPKRTRRVVGLLMLVGCGDRVNPAGSASAPTVKSYSITVTGTATGTDGGVLVRTAVVTLNVG